MRNIIANPRPTIATAEVKGHHGEFLQGSFEHNGKLERGLVTTPCSKYFTTAEFSLDNSNEVSVHPTQKSKSKKAAIAVLKKYGPPGCGGELTLYSNVPEKRGLGSSTQDLTATIIAVANSINYNITIDEVTKLTVEIETASDPLLYGPSVLFAQRQAEIIEDFYLNMPQFAVIGFSTDKYGVETEKMILPDYNQSEIAEFSYLRYLIKTGILKQDHSLIAEAATASARINQRYLPKPFLEEIIQCVRNNGGLGVQISHSGSVVGCLFHPDDFNDAIWESTTSTLSTFSFRHIYQFHT